MKYFIKRVLSFFIPLILLLSIFLFYAENRLENYPSSFQVKAKYFQQNINEINAIVLGSSHNQDAINPEIIKNAKVANIAFGGQTLKIDEALLNAYIEKIPNLKSVFLELSYHNLEHEYDSKYFRNNLYLRFYNLNLFDRNIKFKDHSIFLSNPSLYISYLNPMKKTLNLNEYGYAKTLSNTENERLFENMKYDEVEILKDSTSRFVTHHKYENIEAFEVNKLIFERMIQKCVSNKIKPVILMPPVYKSYFKNYIKEKNNRRFKFLNDLIRKYPEIIVLDYEQVENFEVKDFKNVDHLNPKGAEKFSKLLNERIEKDLLLID